MPVEFWVCVHTETEMLEIGPSTRPFPPRITRRPPIGTRDTVLVSPGSKRTAVPAKMFKRFPSAATRLNSR